MANIIGIMKTPLPKLLQLYGVVIIALTAVIEAILYRNFDPVQDSALLPIGILLVATFLFGAIWGARLAILKRLTWW